MSSFTAFAAGAAALALLGMGSGAVASASPSGVGNAQDTVNALQADGYAVQLNGSHTGALSMCTVTGVHGLSNDPGTSVQQIRLTTVYVDVDCTTNN